MPSKTSSASMSRSKAVPPTKIPRHPASVSFDVLLVGSDCEKILANNRNAEKETALLSEDLNGYMEFCACKATVICVMIPSVTCRHVSVKGTVFCDLGSRRDVSLLLVKYFHAVAGLPSVLGQVAMASQNRDTTDAIPLNLVVERLFVNDVPIVNTVEGSLRGPAPLLQIEAGDAQGRQSGSSTQRNLGATTMSANYANVSYGDQQQLITNDGARQCPTPLRTNPLGQKWGTDDLMREYIQQPTGYSAQAPAVNAGPTGFGSNGSLTQNRPASRTSNRGQYVPLRQVGTADALFAPRPEGMQRRSSSASVSRGVASAGQVYGANVQQSAPGNYSYPQDIQASVAQQNAMMYQQQGAGFQQSQNAPGSRQSAVTPKRSSAAGDVAPRSAEVSHFARQRMLAAEQRGYQAGLQGVSAGQQGYAAPQVQGSGQRYYNAEQQGYIAGLQDYISGLKVQNSGQPVDPALLPTTPMAPAQGQQRLQIAPSGTTSNIGQAGGFY